MNRLNLRNIRLKFKTAGKLPTILKEFIEYTPNLIKENRRMSTCNQLDSQTLGSQPIMPKKLPDHCCTGRWSRILLHITWWELVFKIEALTNFILKGSQILALQLKGLFKSRRQSKNIKLKYKTHIIKLVHELHGTCFWYNVKN